MQAVAAVPRHVEVRLDPRHRRHTRRLRQRGTDARVGREIDPQPGFGNVFEPNRYAPAVRRDGHHQHPHKPHPALLTLLKYNIRTGKIERGGGPDAARHDRATERTDSSFAAKSLVHHQNRTPTRGTLQSTIPRGIAPRGIRESWGCSIIAGCRGFAFALT